MCSNIKFKKDKRRHFLSHFINCGTLLQDAEHAKGVDEFKRHFDTFMDGCLIMIYYHQILNREFR